MNFRRVGGNLSQQSTASLCFLKHLEGKVGGTLMFILFSQSVWCDICSRNEAIRLPFLFFSSCSRTLHAMLLPDASCYEWSRLSSWHTALLTFMWYGQYIVVIYLDVKRTTKGAGPFKDPL